MWRCLFAVVLSSVLVGLSGCASKQKKSTTSQKKKSDVVAAGEDEVSQAEEAGDGSTVSGEVAGGHVMSEDAKGIYNDGVKQAGEGALGEAEQAFKRVLQMDGRAYQAAYNLGVISERRGDDEAAISYYRQAFNMQSNFSPAIAAAAKLQIRRGSTDKALEILKNKVEAHPSDLDILNVYADVLIAAHKYNDAIAQAKKVLKSDERNATAMLKIGKANLKLGRYELASAILNQVLKIRPNEAEAYFLRSKVRLEEDQRTAAINELKTAIEKRPNYVEAMNNLATLYLISGNYDLAVDLLSRAVSLSPSWAILYLNLGNALRGAKKWQESKEATKKAISLSPDLVGGVFNLGLLYYTADSLDELDRLQRLKEAKRLFARYKNEKGSALKNKDQVHKYLKEVQVAIEREETRIARAKERESQEAKRAKEREAAAAKKAAEEKAAPGKKDTEKKTGGESAEDDEGWF